MQQCGCSSGARARTNCHSAKEIGTTPKTPLRDLPGGNQRRRVGGWMSGWGLELRPEEKSRSVGGWVGARAAPKAFARRVA
eukprot:scaffold16864_cov27-Tisochrysis_lutea.AAC.8